MQAGVKGDVRDEPTGLAEAQGDVTFRIIQGLLPRRQKQNTMHRYALKLVED
jgi:hypothetical protein